MFSQRMHETYVAFKKRGRLEMHIISCELRSFIYVNVLKKLV